MVPLQSRTLFSILHEHGASWRVFEHGYSFLRLFGDFTFDTTNIVQFDDPVRGFEAAARNGHLPQVTLIEPDYIDLPPGTTIIRPGRYEIRPGLCKPDRSRLDCLAELGANSVHYHL